MRRTLGAVLVYDSGAKAYWNAQIPTPSSLTPGSGVRIDILSVSADRTTYKGAALTERSQGAGALAPAPGDT